MLHELGHGLGLDHSGLFGTVMNPYTESGASPTQTVFENRSLHSDDLISLASAYPTAEVIASTGALSGTARLDGNPLAFGHIIAIRADGITIADTLTGSDGTFLLRLPPDSYTLALEPLDGPVLASDLSVYDSAPPA